ncbi:MAG: shikimate kinase [Cyanobium sp. CACIAM 14]|nr:MAG: shikimate kinase [Cyanobium sp. CACIAM 14]
MRIILLGNAGAGKSTLAGRLIAREPAERLSLDAVAFAGGSAQRRPLQESLEEVRRWIAQRQSWIIEGCYADIIEPLLVHCDELLFLNPGIEACVAHCRARPWEPEKFGSPQQQDANLENLIQWVRSYSERTDEYGLARHRALFDASEGAKREFRHPGEYDAL